MSVYQCHLTVFGYTCADTKKTQHHWGVWEGLEGNPPSPHKFRKKNLFSAFGASKDSATLGGGGGSGPTEALVTPPKAPKLLFFLVAL